MDYRLILDLLHKEVVPAIGCTEPVAVALCTAKAVETLGFTPTKIKVECSANIYKNAMGVGIPGTGMVGLPIAIALGATIGVSNYGLEVLKNTTPLAVKNGKKFITTTPISINIDRTTKEMLYIKVVVENGEDYAEAVISGSHTNFVKIVKNSRVVLEKIEENKGGNEDDEYQVNSLHEVYDFATTVPIPDIEFLGKAANMNIAAAESSFKGDFGHGLGKLLHDNARSCVFGDTLFTKILSYTSGACDARMSGAMIPIMSNSGSGNQGVSATVPVAVFAAEHNITGEPLLRALALSSLTAIYIKQSLGRLSALCGCVVAATGSSTGITMLMGGKYEQITCAVKNMVANLTGMICDGAKPSCSLKVTSGVATAVLSALLAINNRSTTSAEGIIDNDVDKSIHNLTHIGKDGMKETDKLILEIMATKS